MAVGRGDVDGPRLGVPTFFWAAPVRGGRSLRAQGLSAVEAARRHLVEHAPLYRGTAAQWASAEATRVHDTGQGAVIVAFEQRVQGVRVFRDEVKAVMDRELSLVALSGYLTPERTPKGRFALSAATAVAAAWQADTGTLVEALGPPTAPDADGWVAWREPGRRARARPVWFALADGLMPAFSIELESAAEAARLRVPRRRGRRGTGRPGWLVAGAAAPERRATVTRVRGDPRAPRGEPHARLARPAPTRAPTGTSAPPGPRRAERVVGPGPATRDGPSARRVLR